MKSLIKSVPIPIAGVALGAASLGRLLRPWSEVAWVICGACSTLCVLLLLLRIVCYPRSIRDDLQNSIMASTSGTLFMAVMLLSTYLAPLCLEAALGVWGIALIGHATLIIWFTIHHLRHLDLTKVFPSFFICYVGIMVASVTSGTYGLEGLGTVIFWFGFACYLILFVMVTLRYARHEIPEPARPLFCIYAAPMSLSLVSYLTVSPQPNDAFVISMLVLAQIFLVVVVLRLFSLLKMRFYPSYAAMTFPFVISATALQKATVHLSTAFAWPDAFPALASFMDAAVVAETLFATVMVIYVFGHYLRFLIQSATTPGSPALAKEVKETEQFEEFFED